MSDKGTPFQKGGGGTNFEQSVGAAFLTTLIIKGNAPCLPSNEIIEVAYQNTNKGYATDDILIVAKSAMGQHKLLVQCKHEIAFTEKDTEFKKVIKGFWQDYNNDSIFDKINDRLLIVKKGLTKAERNNVKTLLNWAKTHARVSDFLNEVNRIQAKKDVLEVFKQAVIEANNNIALSNRNLWEFLKCLDILDYDFMQEGSTAKANFLNLIKLCKSRKTLLNESEIWDSILSRVSTLNSNGGNITNNTIKKEAFYKNFDAEKLNPYFTSFEKLKSDSALILKPLINTIGKIHIERKDIIQTIVETINANQITIVTGKPGVGKSAAVKDVLTNEFSSATIFVFKADQFNKPHIANVLSLQGVNEPIIDIFSCLSLIPDKIIFLDSLEKLLEGDPENAFRQLLALLKEYPDIKIIATARTYSVDLLNIKFGIDQTNTANCEIMPLTESELKEITKGLPELSDLLKNNKIKKLLQIPKYLDFATTSIHKSQGNYKDISLMQFKERLWNSLVSDETKRVNGLPAKRQEAFLNIALRRAKEMKLFVEPGNNIDKEAVDLLEQDEIIIQDNHNGKYSPSHDILEDWALIKYVIANYNLYPKPEDLFVNLGNEPSIRRAFRLWIEDCLLDDTDKINELTRASLNSPQIEKYWADELLVAIFKSEDCSSFFKAFKKELIENKGGLLNRALLLIRTACMEGSLGRNDLSLLTPNGSGWKETIYFINEHLNELRFITSSICSFLIFWNLKILFKGRIAEEEEMIKGREIILQFINEIEAGKEFWQQENMNDTCLKLISILFNLAQVSKSEITDLIKRAFEAQEKRDNWRLNYFYDGVINKSISGLDNQRLIKECPDLVVKTMWKAWKLNVPKITTQEERFFRKSIINGPTGEYCWGIKDRYNFFPSGVYKTPVYNLLLFHPLIGLKFLVEFINYSVEYYVNSECEPKRDIIQLEVLLNDGSIVKQWGCWELWAAYRGGLSVTHDGLECLLMSLEKFLLETASYKTKISRKNLKFIYEYILKNSNNCATTSVLTSVAMAYPIEVGTELLPLLRVREFYEWDISRSIQESQAMSIDDTKIPFAQEERWKSNQLPHRKKYQRGLADFVVDYQFTIKTLNNEFHIAFDRLRKEIDKEDTIWKKILTEIDIRNYRFGKYDDKFGGYPVMATYDEDVNQMMDSSKQEFESLDISATYSNLIRKAYEKEQPLEIEKWREIINYYSKGEKIDNLFDKPITSAVIGLRDLGSILNADEKLWCTEILSKAIKTILSDTFNQSYLPNKSVGALERKIALRSFHYLLTFSKSNAETEEIISMILYTLIAPFSEHEIGEITEYMRNIFYVSCPSEAKIIWAGLIKYSSFIKGRTIDYRDNKAVHAFQAETKKVIKEISSLNEVDSPNINEINFELNEDYLLLRALLLIPFDTQEGMFLNYITQFIIILIEDLKTDQGYPHYSNRRGNNIRYQQLYDVERYLAELILKTNIEFAKKTFDLILTPIYSLDFVKKRANDDLFDFSSKIPKYIILEIDNLIANSENEKLNNRVIAHFWELWKYFFEKIEHSPKPYLMKIIFLDIQWKKESNHWKVLENKKDFYHKMVLALGRNNTQSILNLFSTVGERTFLPEGISWLVDIYKEDMNTTVSLMSVSAERLIKRLYYNHMNKIKSNTRLVDDFVWILNRMVDLGSSEAYLFRENVITYKTVN